MAILTYYFDASVSGPTDTNARWSNDANVFDGSTATYATGSYNGSDGVNDLRAQGHSGPTSGDTITQVRARIHGGVFQSSDNTINAEILDGATSLGVATNQQDYLANDYGAWTTLSAPVGGWTWDKLDSITVSIYGTTSAGGLHKEVGLIELEVTTSESETCSWTADTTEVTADDTTATADGSCVTGTEECVWTADSTDVTADSTAQTADGYDPFCECTWYADSTVVTADSTLQTADGLDRDCGTPPEPDEEPYQLGLSDPTDEYNDFMAQLRREDELILKVIEEFVRQAA